MAQTPQKPEPKRSELAKETEMNVTMPGAAPQANMSEQVERPVPEATKAEQEEGKKAKELAADRLKAEQEAGEAIVKRNEEMTGNPRAKEA